MHGMRGHSRRHTAEPGESLEPGAFAHGNETEGHRRRLAALVAAEKRPVAAADANIAAGPLGHSVVHLQFAVLEKTRQRLPLIVCVADRLFGGTTSK